MRKHIWIMNHYAGDMYFDRGGRHYNFAKYLKQAGYEPVVFCANSKHGPAETWFPDDALWHEHAAEEIGVPFVFVKARTYTGNGKQRVLNMLDFYRNVKKTVKEYAAKHGKPDVIYASSVHPLTLVAGIQLAKRFGVKCVCEVRDLWPESIVAYGIAGPRNPAVFALRRLEKWIYKKSDAIVFTCEGSYDYIVEQSWEKQIPRSKVHYINNGVDLEAFQYNLERCPIEDPDLDNPDTIKIVYTGSIRLVNNLGALLDAAKRVEDPKVRFLIWGSGDQLPALQQRIRDEGIDNVVFKGHVEKKYVPSIVSQADYNYINGADNDIFRFGISPNKLFDYFAAGKPVLMYMRVKYNPAERFSCGLICESQEELDTHLKQIPEIPKDKYTALCHGAEAAAREFDFKNLTRKLVEVIEGVTKE